MVSRSGSALGFSLAKFTFLLYAHWACYHFYQLVRLIRIRTLVILCFKLVKRSKLGSWLVNNCLVCCLFYLTSWLYANLSVCLHSSCEGSLQLLLWMALTFEDSLMFCNTRDTGQRWVAQIVHVWLMDHGRLWTCIGKPPLGEIVMACANCKGSRQLGATLKVNLWMMFARAIAASSTAENE